MTSMLHLADILDDGDSEADRVCGYADKHDELYRYQLEDGPQLFSPFLSAIGILGSSLVHRRFRAFNAIQI